MLDKTRACVIIANVQISPAACDNDLQTSNKVLACDTLSSDDYHSLQIILKFNHIGQSYRSDMNAYAQSSRAHSDLCLQASNMVPTRDTLSCQDDYFCQAILKS